MKRGKKEMKEGKKRRKRFDAAIFARLAGAAKAAHRHFAYLGARRQDYLRARETKESPARNESRSRPAAFPRVSLFLFPMGQSVRSAELCPRCRSVCPGYVRMYEKRKNRERGRSG